MRYLIIFYLLLYSQSLFSQNAHDFSWIIGSGTGIEHPNATFEMSFSNQNLSYEITDSQTDFYRTTTVMSSTDGSLEFYTNNCFIADKNHNLMMNGEGLDVGVVTDYGFCDDFGEEEFPSGNSNLQSSLALPYPQHDSLYILFHYSQGIYDEMNGNGYFFSQNLNTSLIDMKENEGVGEVKEKNTLIFSDTIVSGSLAAVKNSNGSDWWITSRLRKHNEFVTVPLTEEGVGEPVYQAIGDTPPLFFAHNSGQSLFSPDGTKFVLYNRIAQVQLYDFDRSTGQFDNFNRIDIIPYDSLIVGGAAFSPDSRYLYVSGAFHLYQIDTEAANPAESVTLIAEWEDRGLNFPDYFYRMQLGPDCRIYMTTPNGSDFYHVINKPNEAGQACEFFQQGLHLPRPNSLSIPTFPNYRLDTDSPVCDPSISAPVVMTSASAVFPEQRDYRFSPNPAVHYINLENFSGFGRKAEWTLYDINGKVVMNKKLIPGSERTRIDFGATAAGIYFQTVTEEGQPVWRTRLVIAR